MLISFLTELAIKLLLLSKLQMHLLENSLDLCRTELRNQQETDNKMSKAVRF